MYDSLTSEAKGSFLEKLRGQSLRHMGKDDLDLESEPRSAPTAMREPDQPPTKRMRLTVSSEEDG